MAGAPQNEDVDRALAAWLRGATSQAALAENEEVGRALAALRGATSQAALAERMRARGWEWSQATVWSIERGDRPVRLAEAVDLADVLGGDIKDLLSGRDRSDGPWPGRPGRQSRRSRRRGAILTADGAAPPARLTRRGYVKEYSLSQLAEVLGLREGHQVRHVETIPTRDVVSVVVAVPDQVHCRGCCCEVES